MEKDQDLLRAVSMYYLQDIKMEVIARQLGTSRSTVSRMIKRARELGLVEITVRPSASRAPGLNQTLEHHFNVVVHTIPISDQSTHAQRLDIVARTAARLISSWFESDMLLGIAWGTTLAAIAQHLPSKATRGAAVVQLNGAANTRTSGIEYASDLISSFGKAFSATVHHFPVPAFFDYPETKVALSRERSVRRILDLQAQADIAVFGVGTVHGPIHSHVYAAGYLDEADMEVIRTEKVVGDVCTVLLREDGSWRDISLNRRASGPTPPQLRKVPRRVCVVSGDTKVPPLLGALRAGTITDLVIDETTAAKLLRRLERELPVTAPSSPSSPRVRGLTRK